MATYTNVLPHWKIDILTDNSEVHYRPQSLLQWSLDNVTEYTVCSGRYTSFASADRVLTTKYVIPYIITNVTRSSQSANLVLFRSFVLAEDLQLSANAVLLSEASQLSTKQQPSRSICSMWLYHLCDILQVKYSHTIFICNKCWKCSPA